MTREAAGRHGVRPARATALLAAVVLIVTGAVAVAAAGVRITPAGAGAVKLGKTYTSLRTAGLLGKIGPGCELGGPRTRSAPLRAPLQGAVDLTFGTPRRVGAITVLAGATARGVGIGASAAAIRAAFPRVTFDHRGDKTFGLTIARVPKSGGGKLEFGIATTTKQVTLIGIPRIPVCD
jgi:hypothetical protein